MPEAVLRAIKRVRYMSFSACLKERSVGSIVGRFRRKEKGNEKLSETYARRINFYESVYRQKHSLATLFPMIDSCKTRFVATVAAIKRRFAAESGMRRQPIRDGISKNLQTERKKADSIGFDEDGKFGA